MSYEQLLQLVQALALKEISLCENEQQLQRVESFYRKFINEQFKEIWVKQ